MSTWCFVPLLSCRSTCWTWHSYRLMSRRTIIFELTSDGLSTICHSLGWAVWCKPLPHTLILRGRHLPEIILMVLPIQTNFIRIIQPINQSFNQTDQSANQSINRWVLQSIDYIMHMRDNHVRRLRDRLPVLTSLSTNIIINLRIDDV